MTQVRRSPKVYDVCIVGSGAAGGTAAKILTEGGFLHRQEDSLRATGAREGSDARRQRLRVCPAAAELEIRFVPGWLGELVRSGRALLDGLDGSEGGGFVPRMEKVPPHNHDGVGGNHMHIPWWKFDRKNDFLRGYHIELSGGRGMPGVRMFHGACDRLEGYGRDLKGSCGRSTAPTSVFPDAAK